MKETTHKRRQELTRMRRTGQYARAFCVWSYMVVVSPCGHWSFNRRNPLSWLVLAVGSLVAGLYYFAKAVYETWEGALAK